MTLNSDTQWHSYLEMVAASLRALVENLLEYPPGLFYTALCTWPYTRPYVYTDVRHLQFS